MAFTRGNLASRAHLDDQRELYLFERVGKPMGHVRFIGQMPYAGHQLVPGVPDRDGTARTAIVFVLAPVSNETESDADDGADRYDDEIPPDDEPPDRIAAAAGQRVAEDAPEYRIPDSSPAGQRGWTSRATRSHVPRRSGGRCEGCPADAPVRRADGGPSLEPRDSARGASVFVSVSHATGNQPRRQQSIPNTNIALPRLRTSCGPSLIDLVRPSRTAHPMSPPRDRSS